MLKILLTKIEELDNAIHPKNIPVNWSFLFHCKEESYKPPTIGERYYPGFSPFGIFYDFSTSPVQSINGNKFTTYNSIYKIEFLKDDEV
jgi:hypothetical protein